MLQDDNTVSGRPHCLGAYNDQLIQHSARPLEQGDGVARLLAPVRSCQAVAPTRLLAALGQMVKDDLAGIFALPQQDHPNLIKHLFAKAAEELGPDHLDSICQRDLVARNTQQALQGVREDAATRHKDSQRLRSQRIWYPRARGRMQLACLICSSPGRGGRQFLLR